MQMAALESPEESLIRKDLIEKAFSSLTERERYIVFERLNATLREIGEEYGLCGARIAQIEEKAFRKGISSLKLHGESFKSGRDIEIAWQKARDRRRNSKIRCRLMEYDNSRLIAKFIAA